MCICLAILSDFVLTQAPCSSVWLALDSESLQHFPLIFVYVICMQPDNFCLGGAELVFYGLCSTEQRGRVLDMRRPSFTVHLSKACWNARILPHWQLYLLATLLKVCMGTTYNFIQYRCRGERFAGAQALYFKSGVIITELSVLDALV